MVSATFPIVAFVAFGFKAVIASPCRPSSQATLSSGTSVSLTTSSEILFVLTSISETSTTEEIYQSETATSLLSTYSSIMETGTDSTGLSSMAESYTTETGTTTAVNSKGPPGLTTTRSISDTVTSAEIGSTTAAASDESTAITTTVASETTTLLISEDIATVETESSTWATTETTNEPTTSMSETTTDETPASTTETTLPPVPTFELVARSQSVGDLVIHAWSSYVRVSTGPFPASWSSSISYEEDTRHIMVNSVALCVWYSSHDRMAPVEPCKSAAPESQRPLTCEKPTASGLKCHVPARTCYGESCTELGYDWNKFFLLGWDDGVFVVTMGADDLSTERDAPYEGLEPVGMRVREASS